MTKFGVKHVVAGHVHKFGYAKAFHGEGFAITIPGFQIDLARGENDRGALIMLDGNIPVFVEPDRTIKVVDEEELMLEVLCRLVEFIKRYRAKSSVPRHSCAIKELFIGLPGARVEKGKIWWRYAVLRMGKRTKVVNGKLLERIAEIYNSFETTEKAIEHIMKVLKVNLSTARNYIWVVIKLDYVSQRGRLGGIVKRPRVKT